MSIVNKKEKILQEQNEFIEDFIKSFEDLKKGRVKDISELKVHD